MKINTRIKLNREAKVGSTIVCPMCGESFRKNSYQHTYCSLQCKDKRHNQLNPDRHSYSYHDDPIADMTDNEWGTYYGDQD